MSHLPTGRVTFLFSDIQGSTKLWEEHREAMNTTLARHDALMRQPMHWQKQLRDSQECF